MSFFTNVISCRLGSSYENTVRSIILWLYEDDVDGDSLHLSSKLSIDSRQERFE